MPIKAWCLLLVLAGTRTWFPDYPLEKCQVTRFGDASVDVCVISAPAAGEKKRAFSLRVTDPSRLDPATKEHALLLPTVALKADDGEYAHYEMFSVLPVTEDDALIFVPIVVGVPDRPTDGRALLFHLSVSAKRLTKVWDAPRCGAGCAHQGLSLRYRKDEAKKQVFVEQRAKAGTRSIELEWDGKRLVVPK